MIIFESSMIIEVLKGLRFYLIPILLCLCISGYSQNLPADKHLVKKGETLYSICKKYNISQQELIQLNPGVEAGLREGAELLLRKSVVPPITKSAGESVNNDIGRSHVVAAGDTWYSLAKKYGVSIEQLHAANKSLGSELRLEQLIQIPNITEEPKQSNPSHTDEYSIAIMLPFYNEAPDSMVNKNRKFQKASIQFYRGAMMAIDSVEHLGLRAHVTFYDVHQDTNSVKRAIIEMKKNAPDICIGPLFKETIAKAIHQWGDSSTHFVMPVQQSPKVLLLDRDISKVVPGAATEWGYLATYLVQQEKLTECILLQSGNQEEIKWINAFKDEWKRTKGGVITDLSLKEIADVERLKLMLLELKDPVVVFPCSDEIGIRKMIAELGSYNLRLFGNEKWLPISDLVLDIPLGFRISALKSNYLDITNPDVINWIENYRMTYKSEPDEFAFLGYDVCLYYLCGLMQYGEAIAANLNAIKAPMISHVFDFASTGAESGFENRYTHIISVDDNGELKISNK